MKKKILYNNFSICYNVVGVGKPVFLIHGFGEDAAIWNNLIPFLQNDFTCYSIDLPGTGSSAFDETIANIDSCAEIIQTIVHQEKLLTFTILGHSMGGYTALQYAKKYEPYLNGIGLLHSTATADSDEKKLAREKSIKFIEELGATLFLQQTTPNLFAKKYVDTKLSTVEKHINSITYLTQETLISYTKSMMHRKDSLAFLENTTLPILFIIGKQDNAIPFLTSMQQSHLPKISYIHILENVGHLGMIEQPEEFNKMVLNYLKEIN